MPPEAVAMITPLGIPQVGLMVFILSEGTAVITGTPGVTAVETVDVVFFFFNGG